MDIGHSSAEPYLPDIVASDLHVIFVGAAPSVIAATTGHFYAGPRNRFWPLLYQSGLVPEPLTAEQDTEVLKYGIGLTGILKHEISTANHLLPTPTESDRDRLFSLLRGCAPRFVCYNGKDVYRMCHGAAAVRWGLQKEPLGASKQFVVHSTSGRADGWGAERLFLFRELKALIDAETMEAGVSGGMPNAKG